LLITNSINYLFRSRKIVVAAKNTNELIKVCSEGKIQKIPFFCVHDAGLTEVEPNSFTALAFFGSDQELKPVTGKLRLLKWIKYVFGEHLMRLLIISDNLQLTFLVKQLWMCYMKTQYCIQLKVNKIESNLLI